MFFYDFNKTLLKRKIKLKNIILINFLIKKIFIKTTVNHNKILLKVSIKKPLNYWGGSGNGGGREILLFIYAEFKSRI